MKIEDIVNQINQGESVDFEASNGDSVEVWESKFGFNLMLNGKVIKSCERFAHIARHLKLKSLIEA